MNPEPTPMTIRPGASLSSVAYAAPVVTTWRRRGIIIPVPIRIVRVRCAASASVT